MIVIKPHPTILSKYLMIFQPTNFSIEISEEEHQDIIEYVKFKISMEEPAEVVNKHNP